MRTLKLVLTCIASLVIIAVASPILWALGRERNQTDTPDLYPYDDNDLGEDVDWHDADHDGEVDADWWDEDTDEQCPSKPAAD